MKKWIEAGGAHQFPFMGAASRMLKGERAIACPQCGAAALRGYVHLFQPATRTGTIWVWCSTCRTTIHLPRVTPQVDLGPDPFAALTLDELDALERAEPLLDRLDRLWDQGALG